MILDIDPFHSLVEFQVKHLMITVVKGRFTDIHGNIDLNPKHLEASAIKAIINTASIHTGVPQRDAHLRSADFFEVVKYPMIAFSSTRIHTTGQDRCLMDGNLSLHGVTKSVSLRVMYRGRSQDFTTKAWRIGLYADTMLDRRTFGITYNQSNAGIDLIGNEVYITINLEAILME
jgi:polyisoprenoid-binding protein YceI